MIYQYTVTITADLVNENYDADLKSYNEHSRWNPQVVVIPQRTTVVKKLEFVASEEEFRAIRQAALSCMMREEVQALKVKTSDRPQLPIFIADVYPVLCAVCSGFTYDPGHSDLDNEQPITVSMTLGDYRRASRLKYELEQIL
jgi:sigma54-dependent transcription regulator